MRRLVRLKNKEYLMKIIMMIIGFIVATLGFILMKKELFAYSEVLFIILAIIGFHILVHNLGEIGKLYNIAKYPKEAKKARIKENDERHMTIINQAKSKAFDVMGFIFGTLIIVFALLRTDIIVFILLVVAYLVVYGAMIYHWYILQKKM